MVNFFVPELNATTRSIVEELRSLRSREARLWMPKSVYDGDARLRLASDIHIVENNIQFDHSLLCYSWDVNTTTVTPMQAFYRELVAHTKLAQTEIWIIVTTNPLPFDRYYLFLDATHNIDYPDNWYNYPCISTPKSLFEVCAANQIEPRNILLDTRRFRIDNRDFNHTRGAKVYRELETGNLYYKDTLHKDHFEVFDPQGQKHKGEASLCTGKIFPGTQDNTKLPIL